jgi:hypothetical protein
MSMQLLLRYDVYYYISGVGGVINGLANTVNVLSQVLEDMD